MVASIADSTHRLSVCRAVSHRTIADVYAALRHGILEQIALRLEIVSTVFKFLHLAINVGQLAL